MDKKQLQNILSSAYSIDKWRDLLIDVFNVRNLKQQPLPIILPNNDKAIAAYELGSFNTKDDRIIGIYQVNVEVDVRLERNKVGLRELLRNIYKYDVDGALVVFVQKNKWRLSFVSEIRNINDEGEIEKIATEPKRYTYLLGEHEKTKTPTDRLFSLIGKPIVLEDIRNAFSVEALNADFYKIVAEHFYELIGAKAGKGTKQVIYERQLVLPIKNNDDLTYKDFAVRLIGRIVFCWFLKVKKSDSGISLLPDYLLSSHAVKDYPNYYHEILEKLFFQTLNTPVDERIEGLPKGCEYIPFLNGGLFEAHDEDFYKPDSSGFSEIADSLVIPDKWFFNFFEELEKYNFTIDENSVVDIEVSVDPEMLGRIFESLLAEIDQVSEETAKKATGSYYTPREIVDYMATESLVHFLHNKTQIEKEFLYHIFKIDSIISFKDYEIEKVLDALDNLKILDPACGSGAFPIGILQKIVTALQKLDPESEWWKNRQINKVTSQILRKQIKEKLNCSSVEYARKIGVIQNTLYGVDIQPIAAEISKLRCFLTLIVDENIDDSKPNRGIEPLPNLEFKFVTADTLSKLPKEKQTGLFDYFDELEQLKEIRAEYLQCSGKQKERLKNKFIKTQLSINKGQSNLFQDTKSRTFKLSTWNPFSHDKVDWFDPNWMFGFDSFDIVIGNPPYIKEYTNRSAFDSIRGTKYYQGKMDLWYAFACIMLDVLKPNGFECFIAQNNWTTSFGASTLRNKILDETEIKLFVDFGKLIGFLKHFLLRGGQDLAAILLQKLETTLTHQHF